MTLRHTAADLARIAAQPGYGIDTSATATGDALESPANVAKFERSAFLTSLGDNSPITCEADMQAAIFAATAALVHEYPELALYYAIPNQIMHGRRPVPGQLAGMPDTCLPVSRSDGLNTYHALYVELKMPGKYPSPEQRKIHAMLREQGNAVEVCKGVKAAVDLLRDYLNGEYVTF